MCVQVAIGETRNIRKTLTLMVYTCDYSKIQRIDRPICEADMTLVRSHSNDWDQLH